MKNTKRGVFLDAAEASCSALVFFFFARRNGGRLTLSVTKQASQAREQVLPQHQESKSLKSEQEGI